jgi:hypothetical protein
MDFCGLPNDQLLRLLAATGLLRGDADKSLSGRAKDGEGDGHGFQGAVADDVGARLPIQPGN